MKSGRNWGRLGMKSKWKEYTVQELVNLKMLCEPLDGNHGGMHPKKSDYVKKGVPFIMANNLSNGNIDLENCYFITEKQAASLKKGISHPGDVLLTHKATIGRTAIVPLYYKTIILTPQVTYYRVIKGIDNRYLKYYFDSYYFQNILSSWAGSGSTRAYIGITAQRKLPIVLPPLEIQKQIASILSALDDKIELNNRMNENLESQAQAIFKSWFVDFEPFGGVMPEDWKIGMIKDIIELHDSKRIPLSGSEREKMDKIYPYYGATSCMDYVDNYIFDGKYLLLGEDGTVIDKNGYPILQYVEGKFWVNNHAHIITGKLGYTVEILYLLFKQTNVKHIVTGAVQPKISQANLKKVPVTIPNIKDLDAFNNIIQPIFAMIRKNRNENEKLALLRDTLLPKLMKGEIDVSEVKI